MNLVSKVSLVKAFRRLELILWVKFIREAKTEDILRLDRHLEKMQRRE